MNKGFVNLGVIFLGVVSSISGLFHTSPVLLGADQKISQLTAYSNPSATDILPINDVANATTKSITITNLLRVLSGTFPVQKTGNVFSLSFGTTTNNIWGGQQSFWASTTLQAFTGNQATTSEGTTTSFYVSGLASTTNFRANVENIGKSTINALTVTSCTGCATGGTTIYYATSSNAAVHVKSLSLSSGDVVVMSTGQDHNNNHGILSYKIISPGPDATTTLYSDGGSTADTVTGATFSFLATTTETVRFYWSPGAGPTAFTLFVQSNSYANQF